MIEVPAQAETGFTQDLISQFDDICFRKHYQMLYLSEEMELENFCYQDNAGKFLISYLKRPVFNSGYFDFETAYGYTGPLANTVKEEFLKNAWINFNQYCKDNNIICGLIRFNPVFDNHIFADPEFVRLNKIKEVVIMDLRDKSSQDLYLGYSRDNRNKLRQAMRYNIDINKESTQEALTFFRKAYYETMQRVGADSFYYFDEDFFRQIDRNLKGNYLVFNAYLDDRYIGGALVLFTKKVVYYFLSATAQAGRKLRVANLLRHEAINFAKDMNADYINFGGGITNNADDSLLKFKKGFCGNTKSFYIGEFLVNRQKYIEFCRQWEGFSSQEKIENNRNKFLKYRVD